MTALLKIINDKEKKFTEKIKELQEYLNDNKKIVINKELFMLALLNIVPINGDLINKEGRKIVYPILHHCIKHRSAISEEKKELSFQGVMDILNEAVHRNISLESFYKLINFQDQNGNTLLHQAVISNNTDAIEALLKYGASPLIKNKEEKIPLDLDPEKETRDALIKSMKNQAQSKKESARCNSLIGIIPGVFLGIGLGVGGALVPSMTVILCALAVSALVAGIAVGLAIYFLSQDYKQAKSIEKAIEEAVNPQLSLVNHAKASEIVGNTRS